MKQAFILAAGLGTRLEPLTRVIPKPLLPAANKPLLGLLLDHLARLGVERVGVNAYHLAGQMANFIASRPGPPEVVLFREETIKGTGGGLGQAREFFGNETLLVVNGDVVFDFDLAAVFQTHRESGAAATMVLHDWPEFNEVLVSDDKDLGQRIIGFRDDRPPADSGPVKRLAYTCVQVVEPEVFDYLPQGESGELISSYQRLIQDGLFLRAHVLTGGHFWTDIGRLKEYLDLHRQALLKGRPIFGYRAGGPVATGPGAFLDDKAETAGFVCLEPGARVEAGAKVSDAVVMAGAVVRSGAEVSRAVLGPGVRLSGRIEDRILVA